MSGIFSAGGAGNVGVSGFYPVTINDSLRFEDGSSAYLNRTPAAGNRKTWTYSFWVKKGNNNVLGHMLWGGGTAIGSGTPDQNATIIRFASDNKLLIYSNDSDSASLNLTTTQVFRDVGTWMHLLVAFDTTQSTNSNRIKLYVNGNQVTSFSTETYPSQNYETHINENNIVHIIGCKLGPNPEYFYDGYLSEINFIDGQALDPTSFGEAKDGTWIPKSYSGSYGTNGFHLEFNGNSNDTSGNSNNWTANNISAHDYVPDSPTNNFATFNPLMYRWASNTTTLSEGNLKSTGSSGYAFGTMNIPTSGKWYFETYTVAGTSVGTVGVGDGNLLQNSNVSDVVYYFSNGNKSVNGTVTSYGATWTTGDVIGVACDADSGTVTFYKNGSSQGSISYDPSEKTVFFGNWGTTGYFVLNHGQDSTFAGGTTAGGNADGNGVGDFKYAPPSGYLALCSANLPEPTIIDGSEHFDTLTWSKQGADNSTITLTGLGFQPDFVWAKGRSNAMSHQLLDAVRGTGKTLFSDTTDAEVTNIGNGYISSFNSDGFTAVSGSSNNFYFNYLNGYTYASWNWKAGTSFSNSAGTNGATIASSGSVNTDAGFSIVSYVGTATSNSTIYHGLGAVPKLIIHKNRDVTDQWSVYNSTVGTGQKLALDTGGGPASTSNYPTVPTTSLFYVGAGQEVNGDTNDMIAYCFADVEGYSKVGSYTGNGLADGPFIYTGFRPAWIMIKNLASGENWQIHDSGRDPENVVTKRLYANTPGTDITSTFMDFVSNGVKCRNFSGGFNSSGATFIYLAFAENPFKYANAR